MPKMIAKDITKDKIKLIFNELGLNRSEIANHCEVGIDAVNKWASKGRIPQEHWDKLKHLVEQAIAEREKFLNAPPPSRESLNTMIAQYEKDLATRKTEREKTLLRDASVQDLLDELSDRGYAATIKKFNDDALVKKFTKLLESNDGKEDE